MSDTPDILAGLDMAAPPPTAEEHAAFRARMAASRAEEGKPAACTRCLRQIATWAECQATEGHALRCECDECGPRCFASFGLSVVCEELHRDRLAKLRTVEDAARDAILADAACLPPGVLARIAHVLRVGATLRGCAPSETSAGQDALDHLDHAVDHLRAYEAATGDVLPRDPQTSETDAAHAAARCVLLMGLEAGR